MHSSRIFFLHNPKAGGSSLRSALHALNPHGSQAPVFSNAPHDHRTCRRHLDRYRGYDLYFGHYGYDAYRELAEGHLLFTNFRDPVQRIVSMYRYWRNNVSPESLSKIDPRDADIVRIAQSCSFSEFIRANDDGLKLYISDFHFRQLHASGWELQPLRPWTLSLVRRRIRKMAWFYIAETPAESLSLLQLRLPQSEGLQIPWHNQSAGPAHSIAPEDVEYLTAINRLDHSIHAYALELQSARLKKAGLAR